MQNDLIIKWATEKPLAPKYFINTIVDDVQLFKIFLTDIQNPAKKLVVEFEALMFFYKTTPLAQQQHTLNELALQHGETFTTTWTFFKILNSTHAFHLSKEAYSLINYNNMVHHVFIAENMFAEFIAYADPVFSFTTEELPTKKSHEILS